MEQMEKNLLKTVADISGFMPGSAFSLRKNGAGVERHSTEHVKILAKTDKPGIDKMCIRDSLGTVRNAEDGIGKRNLQISNVRK